MPRRDVLTPIERARLFAFPDDEGELIRLGTLSRKDLRFIRHRHWAGETADLNSAEWKPSNARRESSDAPLAGDSQA